ncbi:MAG: exo-alpha-sialidase [Clostridia bacterium]|nr:exo-alpha-sialidase [Clostridia bacterium]
MSVFDFPIGRGNPRNSEGSFLQRGEDEILFAYSCFSGDRAQDHTPADICLVRSFDGGIGWSKPVRIVRADTLQAMNVMSVSLLRMLNGDIGLFYLVRKSWTDMYIALQCSGDDGLTWSEPVRCSTRTGYFVMNNDRVIRTSSGRILIPAAEHKNSLDAQGRVKLAPASATFFFSDDDGMTWNEAETELRLSYPVCRSGLQEPGAVELHPGQLYGWARTDLGRQYEFHSADDGLHWTEAVPSRFTSPLSPMSIRRLQNRQLMAIWNPVPVTNLIHKSRVTDCRTPLVYALSKNNGTDWSAPVVVEDNPNAGYCYTAMLPQRDAVLLAYCAGTEEDGCCLNRLRIRRLGLPPYNNTSVQE